MGLNNESLQGRENTCSASVTADLVKIDAACLSQLSLCRDMLFNLVEHC